MPGSSLWLIPPPRSPLSLTLQSLISTTLPPHFEPTQTHPFIPHVTITSLIPPSIYSAAGPQVWLDSLELPDAPAENTQHDSALPVHLDALEAGEPFFKKLTIRASKTTPLLHLAAACRAAGVLDGDAAKAESWARDEYLPHLSLVYAEVSVGYVEERIEVLRDACARAAARLEVDEGGVVGRGGSLVLVDTTKPIDQWQPIATRELPCLSWKWPQ